MSEHNLHTIALSDFFSTQSFHGLDRYAVIGIGCDLCEVFRMQKLYDKWDRKIGERILSLHEYEVWEKKGFCPSFLAKRWAGKEAVVKALGTGFTTGIRWREIAIVNSDHGKPKVNLHGQTLALLELGQGIHFKISLADEQKHALAFALAFKPIHTVTEK